MAGSSTVHTTTRMPRSWARAITRSEWIGSRPSRIGTWAKAPPALPEAQGSHATLRAGDERGQRAPAERRRDAGCLVLQAAQPPAPRSGDEHPLCPARVGPQQPGHRGDRRLVLEVDREPRLRERPHRLGEGGDPLAAVHPQLLQVGEVEVGDPAPVPGHAVQVGVVEAHEVPVAGGVHVGLEVGEAEGGGPTERGQGVLGSQAHATAVRDGERSCVVAVAGHLTSMRSYDDRCRAATAGPGECSPNRRRGARRRTRQAR